MREMFGWIAGLSNAFLGYGVFFMSTAEYPKGQLNPDAWLPFAITGAFLMGISVLYSSFSTKNEVKNLSQWRGSISIDQILKEIFTAMANKSFLIFFFGNLFLSVSWGLANTLTLYINTYFWEFEATQIKYFLPVYFVAAIIAFFITPQLVKKYDKKILVLVKHGLLPLFTQLF